MKLHLLLFASILFIACNNQASSETAEVQTEENWPDMISEGQEISPDSALSITDFLATVEKYGGADPVKVQAKINECCQKKGCWMNVDLENGEEMMVRFKDYGFFVPLDAAGKEVIMQGKAYYDTLSVEELQHYAEDGGASEDEIMAITEPEAKLAFEAIGVLIKDEVVEQVK